MSHDDELSAKAAAYFAELLRVCPEVATGLADFGEPPPLVSLRRRIEILRALPDNAGADAFLAAWRSFAATNPSAILSADEAEGLDMVMASGEGTVVGPPPAPIAVDDLYRALILSGEPVRRARQIATDFEPDVGTPGAIWMGDTLLYVALLSPEHEERIREYLKIDPPRMTEQLDRLRAQIAAKEAEHKTPIVENYYDSATGTWVTPETRYTDFVSAERFADLDRLVSSDPEQAWPLLLELIETLPEDLLYLVAEGPFAVFVAEQAAVFIDHIDTQARSSDRFRICLAESGLGGRGLPTQIERRIIAAMRREPKPA